MKGICNKHERVTGYKKGPRPGTFDFRVELIERTPPTPEKFQRKARLRRLKQQLRKGELTIPERVAARARVEADYAKRG
jgi:hypothetical protein